MIRLTARDEETGVERFLWEAWPKQEIALRRPEYEILFGGARGPGKTGAGIAWCVLGNLDAVDAGSTDPVDISYTNHPDFRVLILRKNQSDMGDWIRKARALFEPMGAEFTQRPAEFKWPSGAVFVISHLADSDSYEKYQGQEFTKILLEEATQIPDLDLYKKVLVSLRNPDPRLKRQVFLTANPGGPGHGWVRDRFIVPMAPFERYVDSETGNDRVFIPGRVSDNPIYSQDRVYLGTLMSLSPMMRRAWLEGDWDAIAGQYFQEFRLEPNSALNEPPSAQHVIHSSEAAMAPWFHRWMSCDWGYSHNAAVYKACQFPNGQIHIYDEMVVNRVTPEELGVEIGKFAWADLKAGGQSGMSLVLSHETFSKRTEERTIADQIAAGIEKVLGQGSVFILPAENGSGSDLFSSVSSQRGASIMIQRASPQRVAGWMYMRSLMRWWPLLQESGPAFDAAYALTLFHEDRKKWHEYCALFVPKSEVLPILKIHGDRCPALIRAIPLARANDPDKGDPEDVSKSHYDGMDSIDSVRYLLFAYKFMETREPFEQYYAKHMQKYATAPIDQLSGASKMLMAMTAEKKYKELTAPQTAPIKFHRSGSRARRLDALRQTGVEGKVN